MYKDPEDYLRHIADECVYLLQVSNGLTKNAFLTDETIKRAVVRSLEIIGEATKKMPKGFREKHENIPWKSMAGMRDRLIHDYLGVNYEIVWEVVSEKIPQLYAVVKEVL